MTITVDSPEVAAAKVAQWRAEGLLPPRGRAHEYAKPSDHRVVAIATSGIGDCLKAEFDKWDIEFLPSCSCAALQAKLNTTAPDEVLKEIDSHVKKVAANIQHATGKKGAVLKTAYWFAPGEVEGKIREILLRCIEKSRVTLAARQD